LVADLRAPTPSAAAEIVIRAKSEICTQIDHAVRRIRHVLERRVRDYRHELRHLVSSDRLMSFPRRIAQRRERVERIRLLLHRRLEAQARLLRQAATFEPRIAAAMATRVARERHLLARTAATLQAVSPLSVLSRGYAIAFSRTRNKRKPILDSVSVNVGDPIEVQLKRGRLACTVDSKTMGVESVWPVPLVEES
ncbi:MAG: Exodeoxyribonuclease large subunit, partial [Acidobacteria bacterium]|nr:Exodeoxyribonuclease large subunit [Acidobacteriota bacterium]